MSTTTKGPVPEDPSTNGEIGSGRDERGRFAQGNPGGPGNPHVRRVAQLRAAVMAATTVEQVQEVMERLRELALEGDVRAAVAWLDRVGIRADTADLEERVAEMEAALREQLGDQRGTR